MAAPGANLGRAAAGTVLAALDVGSGATKLLVCRAHIEPRFRLINVIHEEEAEVLLQHDVESGGDGRLSDAIMAHASDTLARFKRTAHELGATSLSGVATQVFRTASNGPNFLEKVEQDLDIPVRLVTQEEEGKIGFATACVLADAPIDSKELVSWDSGGASFQLAWAGGDHVLKGPLGSSSLTAALVRLQGKDFVARTSPNPVSQADLSGLRSNIQATLEGAFDVGQARSALAGARVVAIGGTPSAFNIASVAIGNPCDSPRSMLDRSSLASAIDGLLDHSDADLASAGYAELQPDMVLPKLCLVHSVMTLLDIPQVEFVKTTGSCLGLLAQQHSAQPQ